ncbi:hypothetical protein ANCCAN_26308 [Ancylostoma caninum]|uniref:Nuclear pore complex protein Nup98-Nup96 n=1 Tax=Ancylostoma caninum TaxID=29170 RepID=A0A368FCQ7_ANCCA|nr:hypothetical protein ANCCAN_26308 [Ancylostoma caninum]
MMKNGSQTTISTKHMCITAMKAYEGKSLEELRIDDYIANRKTPSTTGGGLFGSSTQPAAGTSIFGSTPAKPSLFGSSTSKVPFISCVVIQYVSKWLFFFPDVILIPSHGFSSSYFYVFF